MLPIIGAQWPAMREGNDRAGLQTPVLVVDVCAISGCHERHDWGLNGKGEGLWVIVLLNNASKRI